jgi:hypothetical protein
MWRLSVENIVIVGSDLRRRTVAKHGNARRHKSIATMREGYMEITFS